MAGGKGFEVPAGAGRPAYVIESPEELASAGYTAVGEAVLRAAFGEDGYELFVVAVGRERLLSQADQAQP